MKNSILVILAMALASGLYGQTRPVKIVFDITSKDTVTHQAVMRHVTGMAKAYPDSQFEVVIYGGALPMVVSGKSTVEKSIRQLEGNNNVSFKVCNETMKRYKVDASQLLNNVQIVPDAIMEIVQRQSEGWGYIKESHN